MSSAQIPDTQLTIDVPDGWRAVPLPLPTALAVIPNSDNDPSIGTEGYVGTSLGNFAIVVEPRLSRESLTDLATRAWRRQTHIETVDLVHATFGVREIVGYHWTDGVCWTWSWFSLAQHPTDQAIHIQYGVGYGLEPTLSDADTRSILAGLFASIKRL